MIYEQQYRNLLFDVVKNGQSRMDRTKIGTKSLFNKSLSIPIFTTSKLGSDKIEGENFPILSGKHMSQKIFDTEFEWFMAGETNIQRFKDNNVTIWDNWATPEGDLGPVYGYQLRNFNGEGIDQLANLIEGINENRHSRRHIISLWNPGMTDKMALPPCYLYFQFYIHQGQLSMFVLQRSGDLFLGIPYDVCLFAKLLLYVSEQTGLVPKEIQLSIVDAHIYNNHLDAIKTYLSFNDFKDGCKFSYTSGNLILKDYVPGPKITGEVAI